MDDRWLHRPSYLERHMYPPRHHFEGGEGAIYRQEDVALRLTEKAVDWLRRQARKPEKPFFLYFAHRNVHGPIAPHERFQGKSEIGVYGDFLLELDWSVGQILDTLDQLGMTGDTLVFFASDNGGGGYGIRVDDWKLLMIQGGGGIGWSPWDNDRTQPNGQLCNLRKDLQELDNLYEEEPERVAEMASLLRAIRKAPDSRELSQ